MNSLLLDSPNSDRHVAEDGATGMTVEALVEAAIAAQSEGAWENALTYWNRARTICPESDVCWAAEIALLQIVQRWSDARHLAQEAMTRHPASVDILAQLIAVEGQGGQWHIVDRHLRHLRETYPDHPYVIDNMEKMAARSAEGLAAMRTDKLVTFAEEADAAHDWLQSVKLWGLLVDREGQNRSCVLGYCRALRESAQFDRAEEALSQAVRDFPEDAEIAAHYAELAKSRGDWQEAARRWDDVVQHFPNLTMLHSLATVSFAGAGQFDRAEAMMEKLIAADPENVELRVRHAMLADSQNLWRAAMDRWDEALRLRPDDPNIRNARGDAIWQWQAHNLEEGTTSPGDEPPMEGDPETTKDLALRFEGLGDHCEFGTIQRRLGADPLGLFRFAAIDAEALARLIRNRLEPLGEAAFIELGLTASDEYMVRDTRGFFHMHCFVRKGSVDADRFLKQQITRMAYLKRKLIEDLETGAKIFVHKSSLHRIADEVAIDLHDAIETFGRNTLLVIRMQDDDNPAGSVSVLREGLMVGYVNTPYGADARDGDHESWEKILRRADKIHRTDNRRARHDPPSAVPEVAPEVAPESAPPEEARSEGTLPDGIPAAATSAEVFLSAVEPSAGDQAAEAWLKSLQPESAPADGTPSDVMPPEMILPEAAAFAMSAAEMSPSAMALQKETQPAATPLAETARASLKPDPAPAIAPQPRRLRALFLRSRKG